MKKGKDIAVRFPGLFLVHQNVPGRKVVKHSHADHHLFIPLQGEISLKTSGDKTITCGPGKMVYLPPDIEHEFSSNHHKGERLICNIEPSIWKRENSFGPLVLYVNQLCKELLFYLLLNPKTTATRSLVTTLVEVLCDALSSGEQNIDAGTDQLFSKARDPRLRKAVEFIEANYADQVSIPGLAKIAALSSRSFNRVCLDELGLTPKQLLTWFRVEKAKELIRSGSHSLTEVGYEVGYQSLSRFIASFRQCTGVLPSDFRDMAKT